MFPPLSNLLKRTWPLSHTFHLHSVFSIHDLTKWQTASLLHLFNRMYQALTREKSRLAWHRYLELKAGKLVKSLIWGFFCISNIFCIYSSPITLWLRIIYALSQFHSNIFNFEVKIPRDGEFSTFLCSYPGSFQCLSNLVDGKVLYFQSI